MALRSKAWNWSFVQRNRRVTLPVLDFFLVPTETLWYKAMGNAIVNLLHLASVPDTFNQEQFGMRLTERTVGAPMKADKCNVTFGSMPVLVKHCATTRRTGFVVMKDFSARFQPLFPVAVFETALKFGAGNQDGFYFTRRLNHGYQVGDS
jgi:hypothetical protein